MVRRRQTAIVLASVLLLVSSGVAIAATEFYQEDYEDGGIGSWSDDATNVQDGFYGQRSVELDNNNNEIMSVATGTGVDMSSDFRFSTITKLTAAVTGDLGMNVNPSTADDSAILETGSGEFEYCVFPASSTASSCVTFGPGVNSGNWYNVTYYRQGSTFGIKINDLSKGVWHNETVQSPGTMTETVNFGYYSPNGAPITFDSITQGRFVPTYNVSGRVTDADSNEYINGVSIEVYDTQTNTLNASGTTNSIGQYDVGGLENGTYLVWANKTGYQNENRTITVDKHRTLPSNRSTGASTFELETSWTTARAHSTPSSSRSTATGKT